MQFGIVAANPPCLRRAPVTIHMLYRCEPEPFRTPATRNQTMTRLNLMLAAGLAVLPLSAFAQSAAPTTAVPSPATAADSKAPAVTASTPDQTKTPVAGKTAMTVKPHAATASKSTKVSHVKTVAPAATPAKTAPKS
jgi:hypothetical protein